jgi:hypothetical protein
MPPVKKHTTIAEALSTAQSKMGNAVKNSVNPHFKNRYADLSAVRDVVIPALAAEGIACIQHVDGADGSVTVRTTLHWGETTIEAGNCSIKIDGRNAAQAVGSATTYIRRYQLAAVGGIAQEDDDGQTATTSPRAQQSQQQRPAPTQQRQSAPAPTRGTTTNVPDCPTCQGPMWDNIAKRAGGWKGPALKCKKDSCDGKYWDAPGFQQQEATDQEDRDAGRFDDGLPF